jgi:hypothetical protein
LPFGFCLLPSDYRSAGLAFDAGGACATMTDQTIAAINILQGDHE